MLTRIFRFFASDIITKGLSVLFIPLFSYLLGPNELGLFSEWFSLFNVFAAFVSMGIPSYVLVLLSRSGDNEEVVNQKLLRFLVEWCVFLGACNIVFAIFSPNLLYGVGLYFSACLFVVVSYMSAILRHKNLYKKYFILQLSLALSVSVIPLVFIYNSPTWESRVGGYLLGLFVTTASVFFLCSRSIKLGSISKNFRLEAFYFGSSIVLMGVVSWLKLGADIQFLKLDSGYSSSGILFFSFQIVSIVSIIAASLNRSSSPIFYKLIHELKRHEFVQLIFRLTFCLCVLAVLTVLVSYWLVCFFLPEFESSMFLIYPMAVGAVVYGVGQFIASIYLYCKKPHLLTWCIVVSSLIHPVASYLFVFGIGWNWVGFSYLVSSIVFFFMVGINLKKVQSVWEA